MIQKLFLTLILVLIASGVNAQDIVFQSSVSSNKVSAKEPLLLTLTITGSKGDIAPMELPAIDGFDAKYVGPSTKISIVNGQYSSQRSFIYNLFPNKTGQMQIPAMTVTLDGKDYTTAPINVEVVSQSEAGQETVDSVKDKVSLTVTAPKTDVYLGEKIPLTIKFAVSQLPIRNIRYPSVEKNGFNMDPMAQPQQYSEMRNGLKFDVVEFQSTIYPTRTGPLAIGPVQLEGSLLYKSSASRPNPFNDDFFSSLFDNYQSRPLMVNAVPLNLNILPLPTDGQPADFSGAVGQMSFSASVSPADVKVGDPITLRMSVSGSANFKSIQMPVFNDSRFKTYEPQIKDEPNAKILEQVIIPNTDQVTAVPAIAFHYFDPTDGQYKVITQGPFPIKVAPAAQGQEFKAVGFTDLPANSVSVVEQVDYIQKYIKEPLKKLKDAFMIWQFWLVVLVLMSGWAGWMIWCYFRERLLKDPALARRVNAFKQAKAEMEQAKVYLQQGHAKEFYGRLFKTLNNYLADKFDQPYGSLSWSHLLPLLQQNKIAPDQIQEIKEIFDASDMVRFAAYTPDSTRMQQDLNKLQSTISSLEKHFKK